MKAHLGRPEALDLENKSSSLERRQVEHGTSSQGNERQEVGERNSNHGRVRRVKKAAIYIRCSLARRDMWGGVAKTEAVTPTLGTAGDEKRGYAVLYGVAWARISQLTGARVH